MYRLIGGILLVAGTAIGAGMLALPIVTGFAGFWPTMALFLLYWLYMTFTACLILEAGCWMEAQSNLITMAAQTLGKGGKWFSWIVYLFLLYTLTTAYLAGAGPIFLDGIASFTGWKLPTWTHPFPILILFSLFVYQGARSVDYANRFLMLGLILSYLLIVVLLTPHVDRRLLEQVDWKSLWIAVPIVSTSFGFHIIIPTLIDYFGRDVKRLKWAILVGSALPLLVYVSWEFLTLGIIPLQGALGLMEGYEHGIDGATLLSLFLGKTELSWLVRLFSLFAILTSFLGVSLSLRDFLADGLGIPKTSKGRLFLYFLTFAPPLVITLTDPRAFLDALEYAGVFGVVALLGLLPVLMVWRGRYTQERTGSFRVPGGRWALGIACAISLIVIGLEIANKTGFIYNREQTTETTVLDRRGDERTTADLNR